MDTYRSFRHLAAWGVLSLFLWLLATGGTLQAHALLVRSLPAAGTELPLSPATIEMWFSEPLEPQFSRAHVIDAQGNAIGSGASVVDPADAMHLTLSITELLPGIYTVVWRTLSRADGHEWIGSFPLTLLNADGSRPAGTAATVAGTVAGTVDGAAWGELPTPLKTISRLLALLGAMFLAGLLAFQQLALAAQTGPAQTTTAAPTNASFIAAVEHSVRIGLIVGIGVLFIGGWLQVVAQVMTLGGSGAGGASMDLFFRTRLGSLILVRQMLTVLLLLLAIATTLHLYQRRTLVQRGALLLSLGVLLTFPLVSHAAAVPGSVWAILVDFVHLVAAAIWFGGLLALLWLLWQLRKQSTGTEQALLRQVIHAFSLLASIAVFVLLCTGVFSTLVQLRTWRSLWDSTYGWLLLTKLGFVGLAMLIALRNHQLARNPSNMPAAPGWVGTDYGRFLRQVGGESLVGLGLMGVVAMLVQTPVPAVPLAASADAPPGLFQTVLTADDLSIHLQITPNQVGVNRYAIHLSHVDGSPIGEVQLARLRFVHQTAELGQATLDLADLGGGLFAAEGAYQNLAGLWDVSLYVRRRGLDDALTQTTVDIAAPSNHVAIAPNVWQNPITTLPGVVVGAGVLLTVLAVPAVWYWARKA